MAFGVPFGGLQEMLRHLFELPPSEETRLLSRLRRMQGEGFPPGTNVGRGTKVAYSLEQLTAVLFLQMTVHAGYPPDFGMQLYDAHRGDILATAVQDDGSLDLDDGVTGPATRVILVQGSVLTPGALAASNSKTQDRPALGTLSIVMLIEAGDWLQELLARPAGVHVFDIAHALRRGLAHLVRKEFTTIEDVRSAMSALRSSLD